MDKRQLQHYKKALLKKREELLESMKRNPFKEEGLEARKGDLADLSDRNSNNVISIHLKETEAKLIRAVDEALLRLENGKYGICTTCGKEISKARLEAVPWTRLCISCKEKQYK
ncbi:molecular chaperone DnaK [bacterium (candidate division B38) B3_B38]|nr:MAG: molecular chaperone DnaK [bacterium (candidate division B38) B3_B38]